MIRSISLTHWEDWSISADKAGRRPVGTTIIKQNMEALLSPDSRRSNLLLILSVRVNHWQSKDW